MQKHPRCRGCFCVCSAVSYFSTRMGSIIGADRLSFRVRNGTGRFPVAVAAVTLFKFVWWGVRCSSFQRQNAAEMDCGCDCVLVSFRPVSASSLHSLLSFQVWPIEPVVCGGPYPSKRVRNLILEKVSRLDAFSGYPVRTWLSSRAPGGTTGIPEVRPSRSSRTRDRFPQVSDARGG